ncbi:hypothetical protein [Azospirillum sp. TSO35-2]|uniref:hypothetical protein n=1 Tax=Azospirillum sp. TSO35-2 TaxID=716796 RepID=UPI000D616365|nr:hypothetical protein [Azospirillum sp. TSO35-2]PWC32923.1 hypothetical protein TSO352_20270 [Azospirillum sp. TSO35-2]
MQTKHSVTRGAAAAIVALAALVAAAAAGASSSAERAAVPTASIDFQAITDAANRDPLVFN